MGELKKARSSEIINTFGFFYTFMNNSGMYYFNDVENEYNIKQGDDM